MTRNLNSKILIFLLLFIILSFVYVLSSRYLDNKANDVFTKVLLKAKNLPSSDDIVLIVVDDKSIKKIMWPWHRDLFSDIFDFLEYKSGAKAIVFNNLVAFPDSYNPEKDTIFYKRISKNDRLINSFILVNSRLGGEVLPDSYLKLFDSKRKINIKNEIRFVWYRRNDSKRCSGYVRNFSIIYI